MDINTDITHKKFIEWEETLPSKGWNIHKSPVWTREGKGSQTNTNIDVVLTQKIPPDKITVKVG